MSRESSEIKNNNQYTPQEFSNQSHVKALEDQSEKSNKSKQKEENNFLLIKNFPKNVTEDEVTSLISETKSALSIFIVSDSNNVYAKFTNRNEIKQILKKHKINPFRKNGKKLELGFVSKIPLDLNQTSRIVLATVYNEKSDINIPIIYRILSKYGPILRIIIFKRKNFQALAEFKSADDAQRFKSALHDVYYEGMFYMKIQFTSKKDLKVKSNNLYEFDFTKVEDIETIFKDLLMASNSQPPEDKMIKTLPDNIDYDITNNRLYHEDFANSNKDHIFNTKTRQTYNSCSQLEILNNFITEPFEKTKQSKLSKYKNKHTMDEFNPKTSKSYYDFDQPRRFYTDIGNQFDELNLKNTESSNFSTNNKKTGHRKQNQNFSDSEEFSHIPDPENARQGNKINMFMRDHIDRPFPLHRDEEYKLFSFQNTKTDFLKDGEEKSKKRYFSEITNRQNIQLDFLNYLLSKADEGQFNQVYEEEFLIFNQSFNLIIEGFSNGFRHKNIFNLFSVFGKIRGISILYSKGIAVVGFYSEKEGFNAAVHLNNQSLFNRVLNIEILKSNPFRTVREGFPFVSIEKTWRNPNNKKNYGKELISEFYDLNFEGNFNDDFPLSTSLSSFLSITILDGFMPIGTIANLLDAVENVICAYANTSIPNSWILEFSSAQAVLKVIYYFNHLVFVERKVRMGFFIDHHQLPTNTENISTKVNQFKVDQKQKETKDTGKTLPNFDYTQNLYRKADYKYPKF